MARFPWVWVCVDAISGDLAGLPLTAKVYEQRTANGPVQQVDDPALALLESPSPGCSGFLLRKQLWVDYLLTRNAYLWRRPEGGLYRLHPNQCKLVAGPMGIPLALDFDARDGKPPTRIPYADILHIRDVSWEDGGHAVYGESPIRCLHDDLSQDMRARNLAADQSGKGVPDFILSLKGRTGPKQIKDVIETYDESRQRQEGVFVVGHEVDVHQTSWSPKEWQLSEQRDATRDTTLAVFQVPPARAGLASANYGTQKQQMRTYWEGLVQRAAVFNYELSRLAAPGVRIEHDFGAVEALQVSYSERQQRVSNWVSMGATPAAAAAYEGFVGAPVPDSRDDDLKSTRRPAKRPDEPQERAKRADTPSRTLPWPKPPRSVLEGRYAA